MNYTVANLEEQYKESLESPFIPPENKIQFLGEDVFDFTTYSSDITEILANNMIDVIRAIYGKTTFDYIGQSDEKHVMYITMVNMPFLKNKINWGTSVRGAWFEPEHAESMKAILDFITQ